MPYQMKSSGKKGVLLVNLKAKPATVRLSGVRAGVAQVVEVATEGPAAAEPGFAGKPFSRKLSAAGEIKLGPFAIAVVSELVLDEP